MLQSLGLDDAMLRSIATVAAVVAAFAGFWLLQRLYWARRIGAWAEAREYELIGFQREMVLRAPRRWGAPRRYRFWVLVADAQGVRRSGMLAFASVWSTFDDSGEITWDDA
ncbi:MAG: hypothetical protein ACREE7_05900 [Dongiaceae bacterium]